MWPWEDHKDFGKGRLVLQFATQMVEKVEGWLTLNHDEGLCRCRLHGTVAGKPLQLLIILPSVRVYFDSDAKHKFSFIIWTMSSFRIFLKTWYVGLCFASLLSRIFMSCDIGLY